MNKKAYFFIDDVIWTFRDIARTKPKSIFDHPFLAALKASHDNYGMKVQLNLFYKTDFFYGHDEFCLTEMPDCYKDEWEANSDWLRLAFHARQEFPDYPYVNASYEDVKYDFDRIKNEIVRFAGEKCFALGVCTHWLPMSKDGCKALADSGIKIMSVSAGEKTEYDGNPDSLPYGHSFRLLQNRKPETGLFTRVSLNAAITRSICGYNHLTPDLAEPTYYTCKAHYDEATGMNFKRMCNGPVLNLSTLDGLSEEFAPITDKEFVGYATHEQYFYPEYFLYQTDYADKIEKAAQIISENGYEYVFIEDLV